MTRVATPPRIQLDPQRIAAGAGAIAANAAMALLLLVPITVPPMLEIARSNTPEVIWIVPERKEEKIPEIVPVSRPSAAAPQPRTADRAPAQPAVETTSEPLTGDVVVTASSEASTVMEPTGNGNGDTGPGEPMQGAHLEYAMAPPPPYPRSALREGLTGTVMLEVLVDVDGRPLEVTIRRSSGHRELDAAARRQVLARWTFRPAVRDGRPVQAIGVIPVEFKLD